MFTQTCGLSLLPRLPYRPLSLQSLHSLQESAQNPEELVVSIQDG